MTDPHQDFQLQIACGATPGPDGQPWVALQLHWGASIHGLMLPMEIAEKAGPALAAKLAEGVAAARRARLGIILPDLGPAGSGPHSGPAVPLDARPRP